MSRPNIIILTIDYFKNINQKLKRNLIKIDEGYIARNLRYDTKYGGISKRLPRSKYNTTSLATVEIPSLYRYYKNSTGSAALIAGYNGSITVGYDALGIVSNIKSGYGNNNWNFLTYKDLLYMFNGSDANQVFNFVSYTKFINDMGIPTTTAPSGVASDAAGNLSGTVYYSLSPQLDGYQEGNASPSSSGVSVQGSKCTVTIPTSINTRCTGRYLYRTKSNTSTLYRLATISDNTTTSYIDNTADTSLDTTLIAPIDYSIPASYKYGCLHDERIFLANNPTYQSRIIYSDIRNGTSYPDVFPSGNYINVSDDDGDVITAILEDNFSQLVIFKRNSVRILNTPSGNDLTWSLSSSFSPQGNIAPGSAVTTPIGVIYLTRYGEIKKRIVMWNGQGVKVIPELEGIENILTDIPESALDNARGYYHNGFYYLAFRDSTSGGTYNNKLLVIDIYNWSISVDDKNIASFSAWNSGNDFGQLYTGTSDTTGIIYREDTDTQDLFIKYKSEIDTGTYSYTASSGGETNPSIMLSTGFEGQVGARTWASMTNAEDIWAAQTGTFSNWWLTGEWYDSIREINSKVLNALLWNEKVTDNTKVAFYARFAETEAGINTASWNGPYTSVDNSLIDVEAAKYVQIKARLMTKNVASKGDVVVYRDGTQDTSFIIKLSSSYGIAAESTIEFDWESGRIDLGHLNESYKRLRKRLRSVKIEYDATYTTSGSLDFEWFLDGSETRKGVFTTNFSSNPRTRTYTFDNTNFCEDFIYRLYSNSDNKGLTIRKVIFTISTEPYLVNR